MSRTSSPSQVVPRRHFIALLVAATGAAVACGPQTAPAPSKPVDAAKPAESKPATGAAPAAQQAPAQAPAAVAPSGTLTVAQGIDPDTLDPVITSSSAVYSITLNIYDTLLTRNKEGKLEPGLATSYQSLDEKTWEVKLRENVKFHNGEPFDASAVKFTLERTLDPATKSVHASTLGTIETVEVVDPMTVRIVTKAPDTLLPGRLSMQNGQIQPPKYAQEVGPDGLAKRPVGTGPFKFVSWQKDEAVTLEAVPDHWRGPKVKTVVFKPIPEGAARVAGLKTGAVDIAAAVPPNDFESIKTGDRTTGVEVMSNRAFLLNLDTINFEPFKDKRVRQALNYAVDVDAIIKNTLNGFGRRLNSSVIPEAFGYAPSLQPYPHDPEKAKALLAEAGYPNGFEVGLDTTDGRYPQDKEISTVVAGQLAKVGIDVRVQAFEWGSFYDGVQSKKRAPMHVIGMSTEQFDADNAFSVHFHSKRGTIWSRWQNEEFDRLCDVARSTLDENARRQALQQAARIQHDEAAMVFLHQITYLYGINKRVQGWEPSNIEPILVWGASVG
ncbi:MAG: ABC transporter substrate-binding protein [Chloroflexota bacterium]|nr:ABC transporter substrate-binding protein [Chloroflexota bacterium]